MKTPAWLPCRGKESNKLRKEVENRVGLFEFSRLRYNLPFLLFACRDFPWNPGAQARCSWLLWVCLLAFGRKV